MFLALSLMSFQFSFCHRKIPKTLIWTVQILDLRTGDNVLKLSGWKMCFLWLILRAMMEIKYQTCTGIHVYHACVIFGGMSVRQIVYVTLSGQTLAKFRQNRPKKIERKPIKELVTCLKRRSVWFVLSALQIHYYFHVIISKPACGAL